MAKHGQTKIWIVRFFMDESNSFERYVEYALNVPMYFSKQEDKIIDVSGESFKDFLKGNLKKIPKVKQPYKTGRRIFLRYLMKLD